MPDDHLLEPTDERMSEIREGIFHDVIAARNAERAYNRERSRAGWWVGGIGAAIGVLAVGALTAVAIYAKPVRIYTDIDHSSGVIHDSYGAKDAPDHFGERVIHHYLAEYVGLRERFVWQMDPETDHRVKLMSAPAEQVRYQADRDKDAPAERYGLNGYARVTWYNPQFTERAKGKDKTLEYDVQFIRSELTAAGNGQVKNTHMTARIVFQMHPELLMSDQDRLDNEAGLMVISYNSSAD
jgi:type IV secretory pathway component VirB8